MYTYVCMYIDCMDKEYSETRYVATCQYVATQHKVPCKLLLFNKKLIASVTFCVSFLYLFYSVPLLIYFKIRIYIGTYMTGFIKTILIGTFCILRNNFESTVVLLCYL